MPLFDDYLMVDWSAANGAATGTDSIWLAAIRRNRGRLERVMLENPPTRASATARILSFLEERADCRTLVGFDFPFGYPAGTADRVADGAGPAWSRLWTLLAREVRDGDDNRNNRFAVAAGLNRRISGSAFPFWGLATGVEPSEFLIATKLRGHGPGDPGERRLCEARARRAQPVWKIAYPGAVGSQALLGIPRVLQLRNHPAVAPSAAIWPFESGLGVPLGKRIVFAEIYPSLATQERLAAAAAELTREGKPMVKDATQVIAFARCLAEDDERGRLADHFAGDPVLTPAERRVIEAEEGWILGAKPLAVPA